MITFAWLFINRLVLLAHFFLDFFKNLRFRLNSKHFCKFPLILWIIFNDRLRFFDRCWISNILIATLYISWDNFELMYTSLCFFKELGNKAYVVERNKLKSPWGNFAHSWCQTARVLGVDYHSIYSNKHSCTQYAAKILGISDLVQE